MNSRDFETELLSLDPTAADFLIRVDQLLAAVEPGVQESAVPAIFRFFEKHPLSDVGVPGTLVHFAEQFYPRYRAVHLHSLRTAPSYCAIIMANRVLNSELSISERAEYIGALMGILQNTGAPVEVRDAAQHFIDYQAQRG
jgi:hypothetical protein